MLEWFEGLAGPQFATAVFWTFAALLLLVIVLIIIKLIRSLTFGTFVAGGRNRKTRLAVMDAAAVDSHRRLVLVRRDDVEHLIMIGGPTDVVVERDIRLGQQRRVEPTQVPLPPATPPRERTTPPQAQRPIEAQPVIRQAPPPPPQQPQRAAQPARPRENSQPPRAAPPQQPQRAAPSPHRELTTPPVPRPSAPPAQSLDDTLLKELEVSFGAPPAPAAKAAPPPPPPKPLTLDDGYHQAAGRARPAEAVTRVNSQ